MTTEPAVAARGPLAGLAGHDVTLLGVGKETLGVLDALRAASVGRITVVEPGPISADRRARLAEHGVSDAAILDVAPAEGDVVLRSPGFGRHRPEVERLARACTFLTTPTGLWLAARGPARTIAVTGTKGKSTTATLIRDGLVRAGVGAAVAGNIGTAAWEVDPLTDDVVVLELSSYHGADLLVSGEIAVLTLLTADHLDWHGSPEAYRQDKLQVLTRALRPVTVAGLRTEARTAATRAGTPRLIALDGQSLPETQSDRLERVHAAGDHRARNVALAAAAIQAELAAEGRDPLDHEVLLAELAEHYPHLASRFDAVATVNGVTYVDDALASNPTATAAGLESLRPGPVTLICGGHDRSVSLDPILDELAHWPRGSVTVVWLGADDHRRRALDAHPAVGSALPVSSMGDGVILASLTAPRGATVLFSPMAPTERAEGTWKDRAAAFRAAVDALAADAADDAASR